MLPTPRHLAWLLVQPASAEDAVATAIVARVEQDKTTRAVAMPSRRFTTLVRASGTGRTPSPSRNMAMELDMWLAEAHACEASAIATFAAGLKANGAAVRAALTEPWSSGQDRSTDSSSSSGKAMGKPASTSCDGVWCWPLDPRQMRENHESRASPNPIIGLTGRSLSPHFQQLAGQTTVARSVGSEMQAKSAFKSPWWVVVGSVLGLTVCNGPVMQFAFGVFLKPIAENLGSDRGTISSAILIGFCSTGIMTPVIGRLIDRFGIRTVLLPAIILFALSTGVVGVLSTSPVVFLVLYGVLGVFAAGVTPLPYAKAVAGAFDHQRGLALGISMAGVGLGTALLPQLAQVLIAHYGWRTAYVGLGAMVFLVSFPSVALCIREPKLVAAEQRALNGFTAREALRKRSFWLLGISFFLVALACAGVIAHVVPILTDRGVGAQAATTAISAAGLAMIGGRLLAGYLLDWIFAPYVAAFFFVTPLLGVVMLLSLSSASLAIVATILVGVGLGAEVDLIAFLISRYLGMRSFGEIYGYLFAAFMLASGMGPFLMGMSFQKAGTYTPGLVGLAVGLAVASVLVTRLSPYAFAERAEQLGGHLDAPISA